MQVRDCMQDFGGDVVDVGFLLQDFYGDAYTGEIDTLTGFALVASVQTCFVWQHAQVATVTLEM